MRGLLNGRRGIQMMELNMKREEISLARCLPLLAFRRPTMIDGR